MPRGARFWVLLAAFEIVFGLAVFAATRYVYTRPAADSALLAAHANLPWPGAITELDVALAAPPAPAPVTSNDPVEIARLADEAFAANRYDVAAQLYRRLLDFDARNVDTLNNLGITLHYLGRSSEALQRLNEGIAIEPTHQRIWLTLGFVNVQLGNTEQARSALTNALRMGTDEQIKRSAQSMIDQL